MSKNEDDEMADYLGSAAQSGDMNILVSSIAMSLYYIAKYQRILATAHLDGLEEAIEQRAKERAEELNAEKNRRSYLGKKS